MPFFPAPAVWPPSSTFEAVAALLPARKLTVTHLGKVPLADVDRFIDLIAARVTARLGSGYERIAGFTDAEAVERSGEIRDAAGALVSIGAASMVQDAHFPEGTALEVSEGNYGAILWDRFTEGLEELAGMISGYLAARGVDESVNANSGRPAVSAPCPTFTNAMQF